MLAAEGRGLGLVSHGSRGKWAWLVYILSWENTEPGVSGDTPSTHEDIFGEMENLSERWLW